MPLKATMRASSSLMVAFRGISARTGPAAFPGNRDRADMPLTLSDAVRALIDGKNFATVATLDSDGGPQTSEVWVGLDDGPGNVQ